MGSAIRAVGHNHPRNVGSTQSPQSGPASVSTSASPSSVNGSRSSSIGYVHSFASGTTMSRLVSAVGTSQPPRRSTPARQELPTRTRNASAARAARATCHALQPIPPIPSPHAHTIAQIVSAHTATRWRPNTTPRCQRIVPNALTAAHISQCRNAPPFCGPGSRSAVRKRRSAVLRGTGGVPSSTYSASCRSDARV